MPSFDKRVALVLSGGVYALTNRSSRVNNQSIVVPYRQKARSDYVLLTGIGEHSSPRPRVHHRYSPFQG